MYIDYFRILTQTLLKAVEIKSVNIVKGSDDLITEISISEDNNGNSYMIYEYIVINPDKSNLILMDKVNAVVNLLNGEKFSLDLIKQNIMAL